METERIDGRPLGRCSSSNALATRTALEAVGTTRKQQKGVMSRSSRDVGRDASGLEACQTRPAGRPAVMTDGARTTPGFRRPLPHLWLRSAQVRSLTAAW